MKGSSLDSLDLGCYDQLRSKAEKFDGNELGLELKNLSKLNKVTRLCGGTSVSFKVQKSRNFEQNQIANCYSLE